MHHIGSSYFQCKTIISYLCSYDKKKRISLSLRSSTTRSQRMNKKKATTTTTHMREIV